MASIIEQQTQFIQTLSKHIQKEKDNLDKMYSDFINKLGENNQNNQSYKDIDELFLAKNPSAKKFYDEFSDNDVELLYWYDMNQKQFINPISGYTNKIIKKYNFELYLEDCLFHDKSTIDKIIIPLIKWDIDIDINGSIMYQNREHSHPNSIKKNLIKQINQIIPLQNDINNSTIHGIGVELLNYTIQKSTHNGYISEKIGSGWVKFYKNQGNIVTIILDDHLNIIIPEIKTILVNNYSSFPIYSLYSIYQKLDISDVKVFNKHNSNDNEKYNKIIQAIGFGRFLYSEDDRKNRWSDGAKFQDILYFIAYSSMIDEIKPHLDFMQSISVNKPVEKVIEKVEAPKKELVQEGMSYDTILFNQIKDLQLQVENYKKQVSKLEKEKEEISGKHNEMQSRMKQFLDL